MGTLHHKILQRDLSNPEIKLKNIEKKKIGETPSIEAEEREPTSFSSYMYKTEKERDDDYETVKKTI